MRSIPDKLKKRLLVSGMLSVVLVAAAVVMENKPQEKKRTIQRPAAGSLPITETVIVDFEGEQGEFSVQIGAVEYTQEEIGQLQEQTEQWLSQILLGENESLEMITENLVFPDRVEATGGEIRWSTDAPWLIKSDGTVCNERLEQPESVEITAKIDYGSEIRVFACTGTVHTKIVSEEERLLNALQEQLEQKELQSRTEQVFELPEQLSGNYIFLKDKKAVGSSALFFFIAFVLPVFVYFNYFSKEEERRKERKEAAQRGYVEFITKLSLMMAAGITVRQCFFRLAEEYEKNYGEKYVLTGELRRVRQELEHGYSESWVYENFGKRCEALAYQRMSSLLVQNASKGIQGIGNLLVQEAKEVMAQERANIRVRGEQAGTKLLFPMMGLLFLVFAILLMPAFQSF